MDKNYYFLLFVSSVIAFILGGHSWRLHSLEKRITALEDMEEDDVEDPEEDDSKRLDGRNRVDKPHFDAD